MIDLRVPHGLGATLFRCNSGRVRQLTTSAVLVTLAASCATSPSIPQDQGKLQRASAKAATPSAPSKPRERRASSSSSSWGDDDEPWTELFAELTWYVVGVPWWGPYMSFEGESRMCSGYYLRHPYRVPGEPLIYPVRDLPDIGARSSWHVRATVEYGTDFDAIDRVGTSLRLETAPRIGLDASWNHYREELPGGRTDQLDMGDINLVFRFVQSDRIEMRSGLGLNWLHDESIDELGFNFTYAGDVYVGNPMIGSFEIDWGRVGSAERFHGRVTLGAEWRGFEVLTGFDYESLDSVGLPSWIVGGRLWF